MKKYKKYLLFAPVGVLVFFWLFTKLHPISSSKPAVPGTGVNTQLPQAVNGRELLTKKLQYEQAERDSLRKAQYERQDPYRRDSSTTGKPAIVLVKPMVGADPRAEHVLEQLRRLQQVIQRPPATMPGFVRAGDGYARPRVELPADTTGDARVGQLNSMLDKVIRIQHPEERRQKAAASIAVDEVLPADSNANTIAAVIANDQTLYSGATIALRITDSIKVNGSVWPAGQLIYGTVSINNDRMVVHIGSVREDRSLYLIDLQVYDLDGIAGIHIPGVLSRDVAKQSADQGVSSLNVLEADPSLGAQAANAGIQTVKSFASRKVKQVRVSVRAGYQVLLREEHPKTALRARREQSQLVDTVVMTPAFPLGGAIIARCKAGGMRLQVRGIWLADGKLWLGLEWENHSPIVYTPAYIRWYIRDRRQVRRTAMQEVPLEPMGAGEPASVAADSVVHSWAGFYPFALARDKELVLEVAEKGGGRVLELVIKHQELLKAKKYVGETGETTKATGDRAL